MEVIYGSESDISSWMSLVNSVRYNFPGLETNESLQQHKDTVLRFMNIKQAMCIKDENTVIGVILFSRGHNMICCLAVLPKYRRKGVASKLLDKAFEELNRGTNITVSTFREDDEKGAAPRSLYKKYGFVEGELTVEYEYPSQVFILKPENNIKKI